MNAVEIEAAVSDLALQPFDAAEFPFVLLAAFDNKETTIRKLRKGVSNASDIPGGVLQRNNIHIAACAPDQVAETATDGQTLEAEDLASGDTIASDYLDFARHFGFFLPLAGISTINEIKDNPIDVRAIIATLLHWGAGNPARSRLLGGLAR